MTQDLFSQLSGLLERHPSAGYLIGIATTGNGIVNLYFHIQAILGIMSLLLGCTIAVLTIIIQWRKLFGDKGDNKENNQS